MLALARLTISAGWMVLATGTDTTTESGTDTTADTSATDTGTTSDTGTDSTSTDSTSTDSTSSTSDSSGSSDDWTSCGGECNGVDPEIFAPLDGASVDSPFLVSFSWGSLCYCDTCGCSTEQPDLAVLYVDGESFASVPDGDNFIEVSLPSGVHELFIVTEGGFGAASSEPVTVTVVHGSEGSGADEADAGDEPRGCGCAADPAAPALLSLALLGLLAWPRRRA